MTGNPWHLFHKIPNISRYKHFALSARNPGRVSLPEFPTSVTVYVIILSNDQVFSNVESVNDLDSFTFIPAGLSNERAWYLIFCTNIYTEKVGRRCARRYHPKPLTQITKWKDMLVRVTMMNPMQGKGWRKHEKYLMKYLWQKYQHSMTVLCLIVSSENRHNTFT